LSHLSPTSKLLEKWLKSLSDTASNKTSTNNLKQISIVFLCDLLCNLELPERALQGSIHQIETFAHLSFSPHLRFTAIASLFRIAKVMRGQKYGMKVFKGLVRTMSEMMMDADLRAWMESNFMQFYKEM